MPTRDSYVQGTPSWVDLATTEKEAAKAFYASVFGWDFDVQDAPEAGGYSMATLGGYAVAGVAQLSPEMIEHQPPVWSSYLAVDDVDEVVAKVADAGGKVMMPPMDVMEAGRMAFVADPTGAAVGLWQARNHIGAQLVNEPGTLIWNECFTDDVETATAFYNTILGTTHHAADMGDGSTYTTLVTGEAPVGGFMHRDAEDHAEVPNCWLVYFATADIDAVAAKINEGGGEVLNGPFLTPAGPMIVAKDPQGAVFQVIEPQQQPG